MIICRLTCPKCSYESDPFDERYSVHSETHTILCLNQESKSIRIAMLRDDDIPEGVSDDKLIEALVLREGEEALQTRVGKEETIHAVCPRCGHWGLQKTILGIR